MKIINRVKKYREFKEIINLRKFKKNELYTVYFRKNDFGYARIGILVSKKYKTDEFGKNEKLLESLIKQILSVKETKINEQKKS